MNGLDYKGGLTNHAEALERCQETFLGTRDPNVRNVILLVTDGVATWPRGNPFGEAQSAAALVKNEGTYIRPVFIDGQNQQQLDYMSSLSSDGEVSEGNSFGELPALIQGLLPEILCEETSTAPSAYPTLSISSQPSRQPSDCTGIVNVCFALDMSGSVCSPDFSNPQNCDDCPNECCEGGFNEDTCCGNFNAVKSFGVELVEALDAESSGGAEFSVVQFSTT